MSLFDDVKKNLMEWYAVTSEKTAEVARVTSRRYDKFGISRDIERQFSELGSLIYNALGEGRENPLEDPAVATLVERIKGLEAELRAKDEEIEGIRRDYSRRKQAAGTVATVITDPVLTEGSKESAILLDAEDGKAAPDAEDGPSEADSRSS